MRRVILAVVVIAVALLVACSSGNESTVVGRTLLLVGSTETDQLPASWSTLNCGPDTETASNPTRLCIGELTIHNSSAVWTVLVGLECLTEVTVGDPWPNGIESCL